MRALFCDSGESRCLSEMSLNGISFDGPIVADGSIQRFSCDQNNRKKDEWYIAWPVESEIYCIYGTWSGGGERFSFASWDQHAQFDERERKRLQTVMEEKQRQLKELQIEERIIRVNAAQDTWNNSLQEPNSSDHTAYLDRKQVKGYGVRYGIDPYGNDVLVIPMKNMLDEIQAVQFINPNGKKIINGFKAGNFHLIGDLKAIDAAKEIFFVEGYATGASVHEATGSPVVVAFDCGNLEAVLGVFRQQYPHQKFTIAADDDSKTPGNPGKTKAEAASSKHKARVVLPRFSSMPEGVEPLTDFNDLHVYVGLTEVRMQLYRTRFDIVSVVDFLSLPLPPLEYILFPWLRKKALVMIYAERGIGKTYFALSLAWAIATGGNFATWKAIKPQNVLYIDGEMSAQAIQERLSGLSKASDESLPNAHAFHLLTPDRQERGVPNLAVPTDRQEIEMILANYDVLVLDNLSTLNYGGEENSADSWGDIQQWFLKLRTMDKTLILIHHAGKNGNQRGSSRKEDALDVVIALKRPKPYSSSEGARFEVHFEKARSLSGPEVNPFELQMFSESDGRISWKTKQLRGANVPRMIELSKKGKSCQAIGEELGLDKSTVSRHLKKAREDCNESVSK